MIKILPPKNHSKLRLLCTDSQNLTGILKQVGRRPLIYVTSKKFQKTHNLYVFLKELPNSAGKRLLTVKYLFDLTCNSCTSCPYLTSPPCCFFFSSSFWSLSTSAASDNFRTKASTNRDWPGFTDRQNCLRAE